jgi:glycosyltransferase involved in cell wall biosynthesis
MEAMSYGIPCVATNVGGNSEIIKDRYNGILLNSNPTIEEISSFILDFKKMNNSKYNEFCEKAYITWEKEYNAEKNFTLFNQLIQ